ncbi:non-ribosomal peptide synthetase [Actinophytocola algeriensis]|uniref:Amino acid adenylation domain-containing protein n=1 Tax=Actinophytocola algeriensis TaxID=1768010 RepID=A0A7W7VDG8_9PSEU|nr:non-ribosomal peptide synthetase [Actinophytocola algeriensis]MBB4906166.1 amino acid adenylation domain-containing protein [Actinophytocola algeriensis]MBE1472149.1 amino acid adenylation domain-containing protein [Actinophytocola algeriensis]
MSRSDTPPDHRTIHELVAGWASTTPSAPAVRTADGVLTYGELDSRAARLAAALRAGGVGREDRVGVVVPRSAAAIVAFLGVLKAGAAYVPLDPDYPAERRAFMLADAGVVALVTDSAADVVVEDPRVPVIDLATGLDGTAPLPAEPGDADQCAYVIYTSGSTGTPKGVVVEHRSVVSLLRNDSRLAIAPGETVAHFAPTAFDASVFEIWGALCRGAEVAILAGSQVSIEDLGDQLRDLRPDWLFLTTGLFHLLADFDLAALKSVGTLLTGGDVLNPARVAAAAGTTTVHAAYGPTETTVFTSFHAAAPEGGTDRVPLGSPLSGVTVRALDEGLVPVPDGAVGELYIGGAGVARGYHGRPRLTAERFLPDPFSTRPGGRLYRTGDLGAVRPDGELEFHGRVDRQVKVRGFRIELGEIEHVLLTAPDVASAAVVAVPGADGDKRLAAYVVPVAGAEPAVSELRSWVTARLPDHAVPATFVLLGQMPLDVNGKPDRGALPSPWSSRDAVQGLPAYVAPDTELARTIAGAWAEALELDRVGAHDEFYALGGDSLRSVAVLERLRATGIRFTAAEFFSHPTVAELAARFEADRDGAATTAVAG